MIENKASTQQQIRNLLRKSENGLTTEELCKALQVTTMAVHRPLTVLQSQGLVTSELARRGRGRPTNVYKLTEAADQLFPKNYVRLLLDFLADLSVTEGLGKLQKLFERQSKRFVEDHRREMEGKDLSAKVEAVCGILDQQGYEAEAKPVDGKEFVLKLYNCPISQVAKHYPEACTCEQSNLTELLQAEVTRDHHRLAEQSYCSYIIREK